MSKKKNISRRMFLRGVGVAMPIPFLASLMPRQAWGQSPSVIRRYFSMVGNYDYGHHQHWFPTLNPLSQSHNPGNGDHAISYQRLSDFVSSSNDQLSLIFGRGFNPFINKMNILRGLNMHTRIAHGSGHMLGNVNATDGHCALSAQLKALPTIDQVLATNRSFTPHSRDPLIIGNAYSYRRDAGGNVNKASANWRKPNQLFQDLFYIGGSPIPEGGGQQSTPPHPRKDILTRVFDDYLRVRNGRQISQVDRQILDNAMDRISDIQNRLSGGTQAVQGCFYSHINTSQAANDGIANLWYHDPTQHAYVFQMYAQIFAAAAACDIHRVFDFHPVLSNYYDRNPSDDFHQGHSHRPWDIISANNNKINHQWMAEVWREYLNAFLVPLLTHLDASVEGNGRTILDNSLVHLTIESSTVHSDYSKPCAFFGGAGGTLTTGHMIDYSRRSMGPHSRQGDNMTSNPNDSRFGHIYYGAHYNRSLTTVLRALGLNPQDYEDPSINTFFRNRGDGLIGGQNNGVSNVGGYGHIGPAAASGGWGSNSEIYNEYAQYNYHFYKNALPFPPGSAA